MAGVFGCVMLQISLFLLLQGILLLLMLFMRKRVALTIALFHVAGKVFIHLPLLALQPFCTFLALSLFWVYWIMVLLFLGTTGEMKMSVGFKGIFHWKSHLTALILLLNFFYMLLSSIIFITESFQSLVKKRHQYCFNFFILFSKEERKQNR